MQRILCGQIAASGLQWVYPTWKALLLLLWLLWFLWLSPWPFLVPVLSGLISSPSVIPLPHLCGSLDKSSQPSSFPSTVLWEPGSLALLSLYCFSPSALFTYSAVLVQFFPLCGKQVLFLGRGVVVIPDLMYGRISFSKFCKLQSVAFPPRLLMEAAPERIFHPSCSEEMNR